METRIIDSLKIGNASGYGHRHISILIGEIMYEKITNNTRAIDDAQREIDEECIYYQSIDEAKAVLTKDILKTCVPDVVSSTFFWKDKSGRGVANNFSGLDVLMFDDEEDYDGESLHEYVLNAIVGDEFENNSEKYIRVL